MTMFPTQNLPKNHTHGGGSYGGGACYSHPPFGFIEGGYYCNNPMAEDESRTESTTVNDGASSSKDDIQRDHDQGWLQLGIGAHTTTTTHHDDHTKLVDQSDPSPPSGRLVELDLLSGGSSQQVIGGLLSPMFHVPDFRAPRPIHNMTSVTSYGNTSLFLQNSGTTSSNFGHQQQQEINWAFRHMPQNLISSSSSSSSLMPPVSYFTRPFQFHTGVDVAGPSSDFRIVDPPRRPHSGIWFMLQASQNQAREPFLPQIPKSYLRIKDGRMTVRLLMKYLVNKLRLDSESEIEITCRGQQLLPFLTLQHVRDNIWITSSRDSLTFLPDSSTTDHVMVIHYGRSCSQL